MLSKKKKQKFQSVFSRYDEVKGVFLFGSRAVGRERADSDYDLGFFTDKNAESSLKIDLLKDLAAEGIDNVDAVMLDEADPVVRYEAVRPNKLIYSRDDFDRGTVYSNVVRKYLDLKPYFKVQRETYKRKKMYDTA